MIGEKPYFVWTSNVDHHFALAGFDNYLELEGNWVEGICSDHPKEHGTYDLTEKLHQIYLKDQAGTLTDKDLPQCDQCGAPLVLNVAGDNFQMNQQQVSAFANFVQSYQDQNLLVLELGIGPQNQMIKAPSMQLVAGNENSHYITINKGQLFIPEVIADRSIGFDAPLSAAFKELLTGKSWGAKTQGPAKAKAKENLSPEDAKKQEAALQKFYPNYMVDPGFQPGSVPMYMTIDHQHPAYLHATQNGRGIMYDIGDAVIVHCFTQDGQYYKVRLGLDKTKDEVHSFYIDAGTFIAIEDAGDTGAGFSVINMEMPTNSDGAILVPKNDNLVKLFPEQRDIIKRLTANV